MGYKYNQVKRWETGEKQLRWDEFCTFCDALEVPFAQHLWSVFNFQRPNPHEFLSHLYSVRLSHYSIDQLSEKLHRHHSAIRRYLDGEIYPELEFVLAMMDLDRQLLGRFVLAVLPKDYQSPLRDRLESDLVRLDAEMETPLAAAIESWFATESYRQLRQHDDGWIAQRVGADVKEVSQILAKMLQVGTVTKTQENKYVRTYRSMDANGADLKLLLKFFQFWFNRASSHYGKDEVISNGPVRGVGFCRVAAVTEQASQQINEILVRASTEIATLLETQANDEDLCNDVRVIVLKTLSTQDF